MGYKDDLIQRLQVDGTWGQLDEATRNGMQQFDDEQARNYMVKLDGWDMNEPEVVGELATASLWRSIAAFGGSLHSRDESGSPALSEAGILLAQFFREVQAAGLSLDEIADGLKQFDGLTISALLATYQKFHNLE